MRERFTFTVTGTYDREIPIELIHALPAEIESHMKGYGFKEIQVEARNPDADNTPKWTYNPIPGYQFVVRIEDEIGGMMLVAAHIKPGQEPEARRILTLASASPELYDALDAFTDGTTRDWTNRMANARAALLKANPAREDKTDGK